MIPRRLFALALPLLLVGCQGTPFGDRLSASFPGAPAPDSTRPGSATVTTPPVVPPAPRPASPAVPTPAPSPSTRAAGSAPPAAPRAAPRPARPSPPAQGRPSTLAPYRITLRLPEADPAAPAEGVTQALRAAGVAFEVETIERMNRTGTTPAAAPAGEAPAARPAPAPR